MPNISVGGISLHTWFDFDFNKITHATSYHMCIITQLGTRLYQLSTSRPSESDNTNFPLAQTFGTALILMRFLPWFLFTEPQSLSSGNICYITIVLQHLKLKANICNKQRALVVTATVKKHLTILQIDLYFRTQYIKHNSWTFAILLQMQFLCRMR